jgi:hypothetical protein
VPSIGARMTRRSSRVSGSATAARAASRWPRPSPPAPRRRRIHRARSRPPRPRPRSPRGVSPRGPARHAPAAATRAPWPPEPRRPRPAPAAPASAARASRSSNSSSTAPAATRSHTGNPHRLDDAGRGTPTRVFSRRASTRPLAPTALSKGFAAGACGGGGIGTFEVRAGAARRW